MSQSHRFGFVALSGAPNAGKSTLLNRLLGYKLAIVSRRPQTTRHRILGIKTTESAQIVFVDTPGLHRNQTRNLNRVLNRTATDSLTDVDLVLFLIDFRGWLPHQLEAFKHIRDKGLDCILLINKIDQLKDKSKLLPLIQESSEIFDFKAIFPISALHLENENELLELIVSHLPEGEAGFPEDQTNTSSDRFIASEFIREQLFHRLGKELPYEAAVEITRFEWDDSDYLNIDATIWVEKDSQKPIVIGKSGAHLKTIGERSRHQIENYLSCKVFLNLWVKQRRGWAENAQFLKSLGYQET